MDSSDNLLNSSSRRSFLLSSGGWLSGAWIASQWPAIAAAAQHAEGMRADVSSSRFELLTATDAADVEAVCAQIVPSGATPGAREAHAVYFIDKSLSTYGHNVKIITKDGSVTLKGPVRSEEEKQAIATEKETRCA